MKKNANGTAQTIIRAATVLLAALMVSVTAVSCGKEPNTISHKVTKESYVFENAETEKALEHFLDVFSKWYAASPHGDWKYNAASAADDRANIMACIVSSKSCVDWTLYSETSFEDRIVENANDPMGWASQSVSYYVFDAKTVELIAREIFNISDKDIEKLALNGEINRLFYKQNDKYYTLSDENFQSFVEVGSIQVEPDEGDRYTVRFIVRGASEQNDEGTVRVVYRECTAEMGLKTINGREYWSLYRFDSVEK